MEAQFQLVNDPSHPAVTGMIDRRSERILLVAQVHRFRKPSGVSGSAKHQALTVTK